MDTLRELVARARLTLAELDGLSLTTLPLLRRDEELLLPRAELREGHLLVRGIGGLHRGADRLRLLGRDDHP